ncbi:winged helix-turn-helix transcriptional regulator [Levilactobacillus parabrevis]|uniref:winged helix-turn-helix transcriptional regulator n=1 Tax=Levilactobacillus parabrevis TaxID=357278 RepID=UPI000376E0D4|nr:helix-turn-helix domain-containing protein [Levilactobacillus parabrevis]
MERKKYDCAVGCPVESTLQFVAGKWKSVILYRLFQERVGRYSDFKRWLPGISERMLARQLHELVLDGLLTKKVYVEMPPRTEYRLTPFGQSLWPVITAMAAWGQHYNQSQTGATSADASAK